MQLKRLDWDSNFFGFETGKLVYNDILEEQINIPNAYKLVYLFSDKYLNEKELQQKVSNRKVLFVDEKRSYEKAIENYATVDKNISLYTSEKVEAQLLNLTFQSGTFSRFNIDSNFSEGAFQNLYRIWIEHSISDIQTDIIVMYQKNKMEGFVTFEFKKEAKIGLIAVNENKRADKIGTRLLNYLENRATEMAFKKLKVVTQGKNIAACKFYENYGFKLKKTSFIYHIWKLS